MKRMQGFGRACTSDFLHSHFRFDQGLILSCCDTEFLSQSIAGTQWLPKLMVPTSASSFPYQSKGPCCSGQGLYLLVFTSPNPV